MTRQSRKVFRNQETRFLVWIGGLLPLTIALLIPLTSKNILSDLPIAVVAVGISAFVFLRILRIGIYADPTGVEVRRAFTTTRVPWGQISRFDLRDGIGGVITYIDRMDGSSVRAGALNAGSGLLPSMTKRAQSQIDELNSLLVEHRGHMPPPPPERHGPKKPWEYPGAVIAVQGPAVGVLYALMEPSMRPWMIPYGALSFVGGLIWFWKQKRDERRNPKSG